jgi:hypothetical protein
LNDSDFEGSGITVSITRLIFNLYSTLSNLAFLSAHQITARRTGAGHNATRECSHDRDMSPVREDYLLLRITRRSSSVDLRIFDLLSIAFSCILPREIFDKWEHCPSAVISSILPERGTPLQLTSSTEDKDNADQNELGYKGNR